MNHKSDDDENDNGHAETNASARPPKRVRIAENPGQVVGLVESLSDRERLESWYSSSEFAASKDSVKELCRSYRQSRRYSDCLTQAYNTACGLADRHQEEEKPHTPLLRRDDAKAKSRTAELPDQGFAQWMQGGSRGLEGYSSRLHAMRRQRHFQDTKHAVFLEQARQNLSQYRDDTMLAKQAEQSSRRARSFAFLLGQADAWEAQKSHESKDEDEKDGDETGRKGVSPSTNVYKENGGKRDWGAGTGGSSLKSGGHDTIRQCASIAVVTTQQQTDST